LRTIAQFTNQIFTRGKDKSAFLQRVTSRNVINLEEEKECPSFHQLPQLEQACLFHSIKSKTSNQEYTCALNNALRIRKWISSSSLLSPPSPALSMTWYNRSSHHNTKEEEENDSTNNSWWL